jgi:hypothetical protein
VAVSQEAGVIVRVGIPASFKRFTAAAVEMEAPILVSANALRRDGKFRVPTHGLFNGADVALDSAGFVAMTRYNGFPWSPEEYVDLAASYPWAWWASMDYCCEPEIAKDRDEVIRRQIATVKMLRTCERLADERGIERPLPVLQGWAPEDYERCAEMMGELPGLVGIGSVCRRNVEGPYGLLTVVDRLDRGLPKHTMLHLFGVKGTGVFALRGHPRVHSTDSMAWDFACRRERGQLPYSIETRIQWMRRWYGEQVIGLSRPGWAMQMEMFA